MKINQLLDEDTLEFVPLSMQDITILPPKGVFNATLKKMFNDRIRENYDEIFGDNDFDEGGLRRILCSYLRRVMDEEDPSFSEKMETNEKESSSKNLSLKDKLAQADNDANGNGGKKRKNGVEDGREVKKTLYNAMIEEGAFIDFSQQREAIETEMLPIR